MKSKQGVASLSDLMPVQAYRMRHPALLDRQSADHIDPFPHARAQPHRRGLVNKHSPEKVPALVTTLLRSMEGGLPDYLIEALYEALHDGDNALFEFLGIFDRRFFALELRTDAESILASESDSYRETPRLLARMARALRREESTELLPVLAALRSRSRNLESLQRVVAWWTGRRVSIRVAFETKRAVDKTSRTRIAVGQKGQNNAIGVGALVGRRGQTPSGRIEVTLECNDARDLSGLRSNTRMLSGLSLILSLFFRDPVPLAVFAGLPRAHVDPPRLKGKQNSGAKLGAYNCLAPGARPSEQTRIRLKMTVPRDPKIGPCHDATCKARFETHPGFESCT